jgi:Zn-dependent protease/CBS domain-containing protein
MKWSWKIARIAGIDVFMHWTFLILLAWIGSSYLLRGTSVAEAAGAIAFVLAIFGCVILHEFGHALTARRFGIKTEDITLLPIGGVARLERMPDDPKEELLVAAAGPAVNVAIAAVLAVILFFTGRFSNLLPEDPFAGSFLANLMFVNIALVIFNLLPAFPMDGGRVLRALLATRMDYLRATTIAANIGQAMAIAFGLFGLFRSPLLIFIAIFVYLGAEGESRLVQMKALLRGVLVRDAMMNRFRALAPSDTLRTAADELLAGAQQDFPIVDQQRVVGMLRRQQLVDAIAQHGDQTPIEQVMDRDVRTVRELDTLEQLSTEMNSSGSTTLPVIHEDRLIGLISTENIGELLMIQAAVRRSRDGGTSPPESLPPSYIHHESAT